MLEMPIRRLDPDVALPAYAKPGDAGLDLTPDHAGVGAAGFQDDGEALVDHVKS